MDPQQFSLLIRLIGGILVILAGLTFSYWGFTLYKSKLESNLDEVFSFNSKLFTIKATSFGPVIFACSVIVIIAGCYVLSTRTISNSGTMLGVSDTTNFKADSSRLNYWYVNKSADSIGKTELSLKDVIDSYKSKNTELEALAIRINDSLIRIDSSDSIYLVKGNDLEISLEELIDIEY